MASIIRELVRQQTQATTKQLGKIASYVATVPFSDSLLPADEPLWGGFWHGDVISPGYSLPAVELALLRAVRLDGHWPHGVSVEQFLADLRQAILHPQARVWALTTAGEPCLIFAAPELTDLTASDVKRRPLATVTWYCATTGQLHAGYRTEESSLHFGGAIEQHPLNLLPKEAARLKLSPPDWIAQAIDQQHSQETRDLATRLDLSILRKRIQVVDD